MLAAMHTIGLDVGGTKVLGVAIDPARPSEALAEHRVPTPPGGEGLVDVLAEVLAAIEPQVGPPAAVGVGVPGLVDRDGVLRVGAHLRKIADLNLRAALSDRCGVPVAVDNDADCAAVAEHACGAAQGIDEAVVVTFGTGIGGGIITEGRLLLGVNGFAGEPGHMIVDPNGPPCPCGRRGCWEQFASGSGLARLARDAALGGRLTAVVELAGGDPEHVRGEHVTTMARKGDAEALAVLHELADWMTLGLGNLANILDPEVFVIGGGLVEAADLLLPRVIERFPHAVMFGAHRPEVQIVPATLGERAGAIGTALRAAELVSAD
jgi:glucokinase